VLVEFGIHKLFLLVGTEQFIGNFESLFSRKGKS